MHRNDKQWMGSILVTLLLLASPALAQGGDCGKPGKTPCAEVLCGRGQRLEGNRCVGKPLGTAMLQQGAGDPVWTSPQYTLVCISAKRLGDCEQHFNLAAEDSTAQGQSLWILYGSYSGMCPTGGSTQSPTNPLLYNSLCIAKKDPNVPVQGWPCFSWFDVVAAQEQTNPDSKVLYLLYKKYYGKCSQLL